MALPTSPRCRVTASSGSRPAWGDSRCSERPQHQFRHHVVYAAYFYVLVHGDLDHAHSRLLQRDHDRLGHATALRAGSGGHSLQATRDERMDPLVDRQDAPAESGHGLRGRTRQRGDRNGVEQTPEGGSGRQRLRRPTQENLPTSPRERQGVPGSDSTVTAARP